MNMEKFSNSVNILTVIDYDVLIINASVLLQPLLDRATGFDVIVADGGDEVNAGIFAVRNSVGGRRFLRGSRGS